MGTIVTFCWSGTILSLIHNYVMGYLIGINIDVHIPLIDSVLGIPISPQTTLRTLNLHTAGICSPEQMAEVVSVATGQLPQPDAVI